jgi:hypothetical protein
MTTWLSSKVARKMVPAPPAYLKEKFINVIFMCEKLKEKKYFFFNFNCFYLLTYRKLLFGTKIVNIVQAQETRKRNFHDSVDNGSVCIESENDRI